MEHSKTPSSPLIDLGREAIDPWNEFLSESSEEFQDFQSERATTATEGARAAAASGDAVDESSGNPATAAHGEPASTIDTPDSVVRVSIAEVTPTAARQVSVDGGSATLRTDALDAARRAASRPGSNTATALPSRPDEGDGEDVSSVSLADALTRAVEQSRSVSESAQPAARTPTWETEMPRGTSPSAATFTTPVAPTQTSTVAQPVASPSISLREVLRRHTPMHWSEAVATVEALCLELSATNRQPMIPDLADISITADGRVVLRPDAPGDPDVATLGRTLHALLVTATTPLPLRLFVTSSVSSDRYTSVALFLDALSYYAAPDREALIQALYARALVSVAPMAPPRAPIVTSEELSQLEERFEPDDAPVKRPVPAAAIGICAGIVIGTVAAFWLWPAPQRPAMAITQTPPAASTPAPHDDWEPAPVQVPRNFKPRPPVAARTRAATARTEAAVPPPIPATSMPTPIHPLPAPVVPAAPPRLESAPVQDPRSVAPAQVPAVPAAATATPTGERTIYSDADRDVNPPVLLSRRPLPPPEASGQGTNGPTLYELVVDQKGNVETSRLVGRPSRMTDMNTLQATKNLLFKPASKDGHAVKFRYVLRLDAFSR